MKRLKKTLLTVVTVFTFVLAGCSGQNSKAGGTGGKGAAGDIPVFAVNTTLAMQGSISDYIELAGDLIASSTVDTFSDAAGKITRLFVSVGSRISKGDPIATVDPSKPGMSYVLHTARSPISGTVVGLPAEVGMTIQSSTPLAKIAGGGGLEVQLYIPERFISKIRRGLPCQISLDAYPGELFRGSVSEVSPTVDIASRTEMIKVNVDNSSSRLKVGMFAKVKIITESKADIVKIPAASVIQRGGENIVFVITPDPTDSNYHIARQINVTPGILIDNVVEIQSGLEAGDEVVSKGMSLLNEGVRVNVIQKEGGASSSAGEGERK
ncbi:MAG: efflux RND transporter periplasmic adaptor subunit [Spirochaetaceae bacterium]|jgi:multidrug efflux pump subunit AcrA (membrane-fusion protein)|nr:efflux RND transporter periplasmic adaptor subunit [Spirochaetaceae bacterium]